MTSVTPLSSSRLTPSRLNPSIEMTWISNSSASPIRSSSSRNFVQLMTGQRVEFAGVAAAVHPAVVAGGAPQRGVGVAADEDGHRLGRRGRHLGLREVVELAVVLEVVAGRETPDDVDALVHPLAALGERDAHDLVVLRPRAGADAEGEPVVEHRGQRAGLLGHQGGRADRQLEHEDVEVQLRGHRGQRPDQRERLDERLAVEEFAVAVRGVRILRVRLVGVGDAVRDGHRVVSGLVGGLGQRDVELRIGHGFRIGEPHESDTRTRSTFGRWNPRASGITAGLWLVVPVALTVCVRRKRSITCDTAFQNRLVLPCSGRV